MAGSQGNTNRGYLFPNKGKGRLNIDGRDVPLTARWASEDQLRVEFEVANGSGSVGHMTPNAQKSHDRQPDWRGELKDEQGRQWLVSSWNRDKDNDRMLSLSLTDPTTLTTSPSSASPTSAAAIAPSATPAPKAGARNTKDFHPQTKVDMFESGSFGQSDAFWAWVDTEEAVPYIEAMAEMRQPVAFLGVLTMDDSADDLLDDRHLRQLKKQIEARYGKGKTG
jgi:hypothetical protein